MQETYHGVECIKAEERKEVGRPSWARTSQNQLRMNIMREEKAG